jgi:hypothetical protein
MQKYTDEQIESACRNSVSMAETMRALGIRQTGGSQSHLTRRIKSAMIDTSHFKGQSWSKGKSLPVRVSPESKLVLRPSGPRAKSHILNRGLLNLGRDYRCESCGVRDSYNGKALVLEVDHINNDWLDDRPENLRFLCPNCHSQK